MIKNPPTNAGDMSSSPGSGRSPGEGNGNPLQHSCIGSSMDRGTWGATTHGGCKQSDMTEQLGMHQWLGLQASTALGPGLITGQGTKIPQATWSSQRTNKQKGVRSKNLWLPSLALFFSQGAASALSERDPLRQTDRITVFAREISNNHRLSPRQLNVSY